MHTFLWAVQLLKFVEEAAHWCFNWFPNVGDETGHVWSPLRWLDSLVGETSWSPLPKTLGENVRGPQRSKQKVSLYYTECDKLTAKFARKFSDL